MLYCKCDRCGAEMEVNQKLAEDDWILRKLNEKPLDLCPECQKSLKMWVRRLAYLYMVDDATGKVELPGGLKLKNPPCRYMNLGTGKPRCFGTAEAEPCGYFDTQTDCPTYKPKEDEP